MLSNPPDPSPHLFRQADRRVGAVSLLLAGLLTLTVSVPAAGAQEGSGSSNSPAATTTVAEPDVGPTSECSPGHIVRRPDCGVAPTSPTDPGGWLQVSMFYLICAAVLGIIGLVWWRSRIARDRRRAAGLDPVALARASGQGVRRSTRSEPVAETSSNRPEASAGR